MSAIAVLAIALSAAVRAQARSYGRDEYGSGNWPSEIIERPLTLAQDLAQLDVPVVFNLIDSTMWKPVFIPARLAYGVNSDVTLAVTHQVGFCLSGPTNGCPKLYNDVGLEGLIAIMPSEDEPGAPRECFSCCFAAAILAAVIYQYAFQFVARSQNAGPFSQLW